MQVNKKISWVEQLKDITKSLFPHNKSEIILLSSIMIFYFSYSLIICIFTPAIIQGPPYLSSDTYFSFDSKIFYHNNISNEIRHPLFKLFITPIIFIGNLCNYILSPTLGKRLFISIFCNFLVSSSILYVYRYLRDITEVKKSILLLLTIFFTFFSTNMILCFTIETYTFSVFALTFSLYYLSLKIKNGVKIPFFSSTFLAIVTGGITITNFIKPLIPTYFSKKKRTSILKDILFSSSIFLILIFTIFGLSKNQVDTKALSYYSDYSELVGNNLYEKHIDMLTGSPILLSSLTSVENEPPFPPKIILEYYHHWWQYLIIGIIFFFVITSIIYSYKNKYVQILCASIAIDIVIHIILRFGINDSFIYGAHWVYLIPLFLGWLYTKLPKIAIKPYLCTLSIICVILIVNNITRLYEFIKLASEIYPST